jgi:FO synthase
MDGTTETEIAAGHLGTRDTLARGAFERALAGQPIDDGEARHLLLTSDQDTPTLLAVAGHVRTLRKGRTVTYSPKVFLPVTNLCLDRCSYCTFRHDPDEPEAWTMLPEDVRACCRSGRGLGCIEALMCLGDKPERAYRPVGIDLAALGAHRGASRPVAPSPSMRVAAHTNAGLLSGEEMRRSNRCNRARLMLESVSLRLRERGGAFSSARQRSQPAAIRTAGEMRIPSRPASCSVSAKRSVSVDSLRAIGRLYAEHALSGDTSF